MKLATRSNRVLAVFTPEVEGGFMVSFPNYPGCVSFGRTLPEAKRMGREVLELWLETLADDAQPLDPPAPAVVRELAVRFPSH